MEFHVLLNYAKIVSYAHVNGDNGDMMIDDAVNNTS